MILVYVALYVVGIFVIGVPMAKKGLEVWFKNYPQGNSGGFWGLLLFPMHASEGRVGSITYQPMTFEGFSLGPDSEAARKYISLSATFWGPRVVLNLLLLIITGGFALLGAVIMVFTVGIPWLVRRFI